MVEDPAAYARGAGGVEINRGHDRGIVRNDEIAVDGRKEGYEHHGADSEGDSEGHDGAHGGCLAVEQNRHDEEREGEEPGHLGDDTLYRSGQLGDIAVDEGVAHPGYTEDGYDGLHACDEHASARGRYAVGPCQQENYGTGREHDDLYERGHVDRRSFKRRAQRGNRTENYYCGGGNQEEDDGEARFGHALDFVEVQAVFLDEPFLDAALIFGIVNELLADALREQRTGENADEGCRNGDFQYVEERYVESGKHPEQCHGGGGDGACGNGLLLGDDGYTEGSLGANLGLAGNLSDDGQHGVGDMSRSGKESESVGDQRADDGYLRRIFPQELFGEPDEIIQTSGRLHGRSRRDDRGDHEHDVDRRRRGFESEEKHQDGHADPSHHPEPDSPEACADNNRGKNKQ